MDLDTPEERRRLVLHVISADPAVEWVRPMTPNAKMVGPILPLPAQPLPQDLEVCPHVLAHAILQCSTSMSRAGLAEADPCRCPGSHLQGLQGLPDARCLQLVAACKHVWAEEAAVLRFLLVLAGVHGRGGGAGSHVSGHRHRGDSG